jgi:hypothetical protein
LASFYQFCYSIYSNGLILLYPQLLNTLVRLSIPKWYDTQIK